MRVHRALGIAVVVQACLVLTACTPEAITAFTSVATVIVQPDTLEIDVDAHAPLSAAGYNAYGLPLLGLPPSWSSADPSVAQVTQSGDVVGIDTGVTTITATVSGRAGSSTVKVRRRVATVSVAPASAAVAPGQTVQLTETLRSASGQLITGRTVTWSSASTTVATVSATGLVTAVTPGVAVITATCEGKSGSATVTVTAIPVASVAVTPASAAIFVGGTAQLTATAKDANENVLSGRTTTWSTSNAAVATVTAAGVVTAVAVGAATIAAAVEGVSATSAITTSIAPVASVLVTPASYLVPVGQTGQLSATLKDASGNVLTNRAITWVSSNIATATVSATGLVTPVDVGSTTVTATSEGKTGTAAITVLAAGSNPNDPELPRVTLDTRYVVPTGQTIAVPAGGDLQAALNAAQPCDVITLAAGATYVGSFTLPNKPGACWITIRSAASDAELPAEGARITPAYASALPKLVSPDPGPALKTAPGAHHYRLLAVEITVAASVTLNYGIVTLGEGFGVNTLSEVPTNLILDRVYVHGHSALDVSRCVALNSASTAVIDSYLSECHARGFDSQAICGWNGPGPFKIMNNYLEGAGENIMFGGADPSVPNLTPSDIEIKRNHFSRPTSWKGVWTVKNLFELKHAQRVLVEGNVFENQWADAQDGFAMVWKSENQSNTAPWSVTRDVTFRYNRIRNAGGGITVLSSHPGGNEAVPASRIKIAHNIFDNINVGVFSGHGRLFQVLRGPGQITIEHNTTLNSDASNSAVIFDVLPQAANFVFRNNVTTKGQYGVFGSGVGEGKVALDYYAAPGYVFQRNVIVAATASAYPPDNFFPTSTGQVGFVNFAAGNYRLASSSVYKLLATNGTDPGADIDAVEAATQGVIVP